MEIPKKSAAQLMGREIHPLIFWGVITVALSVALLLILFELDLAQGVFILLLIPVAAYLVIMGVFITYFHQLSRERRQLLAEQLVEETTKSDEFRHLNAELQTYAKQLYDKDLELTLANKRLQSLEQAKSKFVAVTTHQLRTPLSAIKWTFHMFLGNNLGGVTDEQRNFLQKGYESTERMIAIVNDLLNIDYIEADKAEYNFVKVNLDKLISSVMFEFTNQCESKNIKIDYLKLDRTPPEVTADPVKISMVVENLIDNAIKYTPPGGRVTIALKDDRLNSARSSLEVMVADTGIGIPGSERDRLFHRFFRASNAIKIHTDGTGLGLFISRDIIEKHGGEIWFETREGEGTAFYFTLPITRTI